VHCRSALSDAIDPVFVGVNRVSAIFVTDPTVDSTSQRHSATR
jgi:hypothetical protein